MKNTILTFCCILLQQSLFAENKDWLIDGSPYKTEVNLSSDKKQIELTNGLLRRSFSLTPNGATIALDNLMTGQNELRAVRPEAVLVINGKEYPVGGLEGQPVHNFLTKDFLSGMQLCDSAFVLAGYTVSETKERFPWKPNEAWISNRYPWPAPGKRITFTYRAPRKIVDECKGLTIRIVYELYDGAPILSKWIEIENNGQKAVTLDSFKSEVLALVETAPKVHYGEPHEVRMMAPWTQENPIFMHVRESSNQAVKQAIDQCAAVGFEMVIMTFGSGFQIENDSVSYLQRMKALNNYAADKGIAIGGYSLLASRGAKPKDAAISHHTGYPAKTREEGSRFGLSPCIASDWGSDYFKRLKNFFHTTGMNVFENDGSYPGDPCSSTVHSGHKGYLDSQWKQWNRISSFYQWCRAKGIYLNVPDWYFLMGSNKTPMGYVETNWSLPRSYQEIIERQNIYDGTWQKTPSMGFMFVPLTQYHGGGAAATIEPLNEHLDHYETRLRNLFGAGVQACYRGPRLYDTEQTRKLVTQWVAFYKQYRQILDSDIIHLRRPDGQDWDGIMHVNPQSKRKAFISVYNPLDIAIEKEIEVPLYYTGLTDKAIVKEQDKNGKEYSLARDYSISLKIRIPAKGYNWYIIE